MQQRQRSAEGANGDRTEPPGQSAGPGKGLQVQLKQLDYEGGEKLLTPSGGGDDAPAETPVWPLAPHYRYVRWNAATDQSQAAPTGGLRSAGFEVAIDPLYARQLAPEVRPPALSPIRLSQVVNQDLASAVRTELSDLGAILPAAGRLAYPEPGESFDDAARAWLASLDRARLSTLASEAMNAHATTVRGGPFAREVAVAVEPLAHLSEIIADPLRVAHQPLFIPLPPNVAGCDCVKLTLEGHIGRDAFRAGGASARQSAEAALQAWCDAPDTAAAIAAEVDALAAGPFDLAFKGRFSVQGLEERLRAAVEGTVELTPGSLCAKWRFNRSAVKGLAADAPIDVAGGGDDGDGSAAITVGVDLALELAALHQKLPGADGGELIRQVDPTRTARLGEGGGGPAAGGARLALVLLDPARPEGASAAAAVLGAAGYEVEVRELPGEAAASRALIPVEEIEMRRARAAEAEATAGGAAMGLLGAAAPGDAVVLYLPGRWPAVSGLAASQARGRGLHASILVDAAGTPEKEALLLSKSAEADAALEADATLPSVSPQPQDTELISREVFIAMRLARIVARGPHDSCWGTAKEVLHPSTLFTRGRFAGGLGQLSNDGLGSPREVYVVLVEHIERLRGEAYADAHGGEAAAVADGSGGAEVHTSVGGDDLAPDRDSWTQKALATGGGDLDDALTQTARSKGDHGLDSRHVEKRGAGAGAGAKKRALIVGQSMPSPYIPGALRDASAMAARRKAEGFEVEHQQDLAGAALSLSIRAFGDGAQRGERLAFYYAGHGGRDGLYGADAVVTPTATVAAMTARASASGAKVTTTVDACYSGVLEEEAKGALGGADHLPLIGPLAGDPPQLGALLEVAAKLRDVYLVQSGGGATQKARTSDWATWLAALTKGGVDAGPLDALRGTESSAKVPLPALALVYAAIQRRVEGLRHEAKKAAWLGE